jgi:hypothetical protein
MEATIVEFLSLPYWSRIWIIQEVMLPSKAVILVDLRSFAFIIVELRGRLLVHREWRRFTTLPGYWFMFEKYDTRPLDIELPFLVRNFSSSRCNNIFDRVYAMLSLVKNGHQFTVNYDAAPETVLRRTMLFCMDETCKGKLSLDELLEVGAMLITTLKVWPYNFSVARSPTSNRCLPGKREKLENSELSIKYDSSTTIGACRGESNSGSCEQFL